MVEKNSKKLLTPLISTKSAEPAFVRLDRRPGWYRDGESLLSATPASTRTEREDQDSVAEFVASSPYMNFPDPVQGSSQSFEPRSAGSADRYGYRWNNQAYTISGSTPVVALMWVLMETTMTTSARSRLVSTSNSTRIPTAKSTSAPTGSYPLVKGVENSENKAIPNDGAPNNIIAPFWDDLVVGR